MKISNEQLIKIIGFWHETVNFENLFTRPILETINIKGKEIIDLVGPRRSGKSSVLKLIIKNLNSNFLYINFEDPFFITYNNPEIIEEIISVFKEYFNPDLKYIFFDEIHEIKYWEKAIRKLRDGTKYKIFITGSSSKLLSGEISSLITGRHLSYRILPLSYEEFLIFKKIKLKEKKDITLKDKKLLKEFDEYLKIGGFPEVVLTNNQELLKNYFYDIIQKDIIMRYEIREKNILEKMAVYLLTNSGKIISRESLKEAFKLSFVAVDSYLEYLKDAFLIFELPQFSYSLKRQNKAFKKIYSVDTGLTNSVSFKFSEDIGRALENIVFLELKKKEYELFYYKTKDNLEIDFLIKERTKITNLIQVCWNLEEEKTKEREIKGLINAMNELNLSHSLILTYNDEEEIKINEKLIIIKPVYKWLLMK
ncbi:MAG: ATP-binding protein [Candidatus Firestonebacteria bacterium]|nr:ATP-binding protein [Candidatus Firestonebacteria bacterium]